LDLIWFTLRKKQLQTKNGMSTILDGVKYGPEKLGRNDVILSFLAEEHQTQ